MFALIIAVILEWSRSDSSNLNVDSFTVTEPTNIWKPSSLTTNGFDCRGSRKRNIGQNGKEVRRSSKHSRSSREVQRHYRVPNRRSSAQTISLMTLKSKKSHRFAQETSKDAIYCQKRTRLKKNLRKGHIGFRYNRPYMKFFLTVSCCCWFSSSSLLLWHV